jgi:hypothetical protein
MLYFINILIFSFFTAKQNNAIGNWNTNIHKSTVSHLYLQPKNFRCLLFSLLYLSFGLRLRSVLEFGFTSEGKMQKIISLLWFCSVDRINQIQRLDVLTGVLAWSWWDVTLCLGWVAPSTLNYRGAFTCGIKNAPRSFEMLESTHPNDTPSYPRTLECPQHIPFIACCKNCRKHLNHWFLLCGRYLCIFSSNWVSPCWIRFTL